MNKIMENIFENRFVEKLRTENIYDDNEYRELVEGLKNLSVLLKTEEKIDKTLAERLFSLNDFLIGYINICTKINDKFGFQDKVIDAWSEVNELIVCCLCN